MRGMCPPWTPQPSAATWEHLSCRHPRSLLQGQSGSSFTTLPSYKCVLVGMLDLSLLKCSATFARSHEGHDYVQQWFQLTGGRLHTPVSHNLIYDIIVNALQVSRSAANRCWAVVDRQQRPKHTAVGCCLPTAKLCDSRTSSCVLCKHLQLSISSKQLYPAACTVQILPAYCAAGFDCRRNTSANSECSFWPS